MKILVFQLKTLFMSLSKKRKDFSKKTVVINVHEVSDVIEYLSKYLADIISAFDIEPTVKPSVEGALIELEVDTTHNSILNW